MATFVINKNANGRYRFSLIDTINETILTSTNDFHSRRDSQKVIKQVKANATRDNAIVKRASSKGGIYFLLKNEDGKTIARGSVYHSEAGYEYAVHVVKKTAEAELVS
jgi:uncharacterized protein YegP (UPF0339 family)